jgi:hypothetical protein
MKPEHASTKPQPARPRFRAMLLQDVDELLAHEAGCRAGQKRREVAERRLFNVF